MTTDRRRLGWLAAYASLVVALPGMALMGGTTTPRRWAEAVSSALAFEAFGILLLQFALVSRLAPVSRVFGSDALSRLHRNMAIVALAFLLAHPLLLGAGRTWSAWSPTGGPAGMRAGAIAFWIAIAIAVTSVARRRLRLSYESWQVIHLAGACVLAAAATAHLVWMGPASQSAIVRSAAGVYAALFLALLMRYRVLRPIRLARHPWAVVSNGPIGGSTRLVRVRPVGHPGFAFEPGQFAWLATGRHPLWSGQHPLSIASSDRRPDDRAIDFAIKALGDWSTTVVPALSPGDRVFVDGPFGAFTPDLVGRAPLVFIAGGIGIAPMRSMLLALVDRRDTRPILLFSAAANRTRLIAREEIEQLRGRLNLTVVDVFERPDAGWTGARGFLTADLLRRHLTPAFDHAEYFVCGPVPMMDAVEGLLAGLGVPSSRVHTERFQVV